MAIRTANNQSLTEITTLPSAVSVGSLVLLATETASSSATVSFTSGIDSTYDEYVFKFIDIHPATNNVTFTVRFRDGSTAYDATKTTTFFRAYHYEDDSSTALEYRTPEDLAQSTDFQRLTEGTGSDNDQSCSGILHLFHPSSTTFVKHFIANIHSAHAADFPENNFIAGYCNVTAAIDGVQFAMSSGNIDAGVIKMYGVAYWHLLNIIIIVLM